MKYLILENFGLYGTLLIDQYPHSLGCGKLQILLQRKTVDCKVIHNQCEDKKIEANLVFHSVRERVQCLPSLAHSLLPLSELDQQLLLHFLRDRHTLELKTYPHTVRT